MSLFLAVTAATTAHGATLSVGPSGVHATIGDAVAASAAGDRIEVEPGTYVESSLVIPFELEIVGTGGSEATTWEYGGGVATVRTDGVTAVVRGFTLTGGGRRALRVRSGSDLTVEDVVVTGMGNSTTSGGAAYVHGGSALTAIDSTFVANEGQRGGHIYTSSSTLVCERCTLTDGLGTDGGAIYSTNGSTVTLIDPTLRDNTAVDGGVALGGHMAVRNSTLDIVGGRFEGGLADRGGHLRGTSSTVAITGTVFTGGTASDLGGSLAVDGGSLTLDNVMVSGATAVLSGGCIATNDADLTMVGGEVSDCSATDAGSSLGGALYTFGVGTTTITDTLFARNVSPFAGGAMRLGELGVVTLERVTLEDNVSGFGGAVHADSLMLTVLDSVFHSNMGSHGGSIRWAQIAGELWIEGSEFDLNDASALGGALYAHDSDSVVILDSIFRDNTAVDGGGAYLNNLSELEARRSLFCNNAADDDGGGAYSVSVSTSEQWTNNAFVDNQAVDGGGALVVEGGVQTTVAFNDVLGSSSAAGAVRTFDNGLSFTDNIVAQTLSGGGLHAGSAIPDAQIDRNTWWVNSPDDLSGAQSTWGASNQVTDPQLQVLSLDGDCSNDLLWPSLGSPVVDRGDPALLDPDGTRADVGAYGGPFTDPTPFADDDSDGWILMFDCDDDDPNVFPLALDPVDGIDQNCDGMDGCDLDNDHWDSAACGGADCDDDDALVFPDASETAGDTVDSNCDGRDDPLPPAVDFEITIDNLSSETWRGGLLAVLSEGGVMPSLLDVGPAPTGGDRFDTSAFGTASCDLGFEDDGEGVVLSARWSTLALGVDAYDVGDLAPGTSVTVTVSAQPGEVLSFVAWVDGTEDDVVAMHEAGDLFDTSVALFNDLGMPLFFPRFDIGGYDLNSVDPSDGTAADCASTCPALGCFVAPGNDSVGSDAGGSQSWPAVDDLQTWPGFVLDPDDSPLTGNGIGSPTVVYRTAVNDWVMLFETHIGTAADCPVGTWGIGAARSDDGWNWTIEPSLVVEPAAGTYHSCVAAHPAASLDADGQSIHLWFKAEQDDLACVTGAPGWGCNQYTGVGYAHLDANLTVDALNAIPAIVSTDVFGFPTVMESGANRWVMVLASFPELYVATASAPEGPYALEATPFLSPGMDSWNMTEIFNPALVCDPTAADPIWMLYGGRTRAGVYGPIIEGGVAAATTSDLVTWVSQLPYLTFVGDLPWRHWDVVRVGSERLVYYSQKDDSGLNHVGVAGTTDLLFQADLASRSCP